MSVQQRDFGEPLDDVIVDFEDASKNPARLSLQVKRSLTISKAETNKDFRDIIRDSWATLNKFDFRVNTDRWLNFRVVADDESTSLFFTARLPGEEEYRDVYVHSYREKWWDRSEAEVDGCQETYAAANPEAQIIRLDIPLYRILGADWSEELADELTTALEEASRAGEHP